MKKLLFLVLSFLVVFLSIVFFGFSKTSGSLLDKVYNNSSDIAVYKDKGKIEVDGLVVNTINTLSKLAVGLGVMFMMIGGLKFLLGAHDEGKFTQNRKNLIFIILGLIISLSAVAIIILIQSVVKTF